MVAKMRNQTRTRQAAITQPKRRRPALPRARASARVAVTRAVLGNTKDHQVIWKGMFRWLSDRTAYFHSDPTDTMKNQMLRPQSHSAASSEITRTMKAACCSPSKFRGRITSEFWPRRTVQHTVRTCCLSLAPRVDSNSSNPDIPIPATVNPLGPIEINC